MACGISASVYWVVGSFMHSLGNIPLVSALSCAMRSTRPRETAALAQMELRVGAGAFLGDPLSQKAGLDGEEMESYSTFKTENVAYQRKN